MTIYADGVPVPVTAYLWVALKHFAIHTVAHALVEVIA